MRIQRAILDLERADGVATVGTIARAIGCPAPAVRQRCAALRRSGDLIGRGTVRLAARPLIALGEAPMIYLVDVPPALVDDALAAAWHRHDHPRLSVRLENDPAAIRIICAIAATSDLVIVRDELLAARRDVVRAQRAGVPVVVGAEGLRAYLAPLPRRE